MRRQTVGSARYGLRRALMMMALFAASAAGATPVLAQGTAPDSRVAIDLTGGYQTSRATFTQTVSFEEYSETGSLTVNYATNGRPIAQAGVIARVWRNLGFGVAASSFSDSGTAQISALVPNPLVTGQPRQVNGPASVLHEEVVTQLQAVYWTQLTPRIELTVSGGPSIFRVDQDFVSDVSYTQTFPYTTATYQGATTVRQRQTVTGGSVSGDVGWRLARHLSLAGVARVLLGVGDVRRDQRAAGSSWRVLCWRRDPPSFVRGTGCA